MIRRTSRRINFVPIDMLVQDFHAISPETTTCCRATAAAMGPQPSVAIMKAIERNNQDTIKAVAADIALANETIAQLIQEPEVFAQLNIQVEKLRIEAAGYCRPGPVRPPYNDIAAEHAAASRERGRRWAALCERMKLTTSAA
jgi:trans-o-hydroxybenzylidenepyruvate hydratase-aldolase